MRRIFSVLAIGLFACAMTCTDVSAQATAQINGTARDQSGAVLPGVEVTATQAETGITRMSITNETGTYILPNLPLGPYRLEAGLPGFRTFVRSGIVLQVNANVVINVVLEIGQVTEQVEVQANASLVETRSATVGQIMETQRIVELPLNGRNSQELLLLGGAAVQMAPAGGDSFPGRLMVSSAGARGPATDYALDGIRHIDPWDGLAAPLPFPDALAEFKTETSGVGAQQARASGATIVTKSGTNTFHGNLFEFVRNDLFAARPYFATKGSTLKRNQFGGTLGGPILKNKLFFFSGFQATTLRQDPADARSFVPTPAMLAGDFTTVTSAACQSSGRPITLRAPFANNRIDPALFSPAAVKLSSFLPKTTDPCGEVKYGRKANTNDSQFLIRGDYEQSAQHSLFGRFMRSYYNNPSPFSYTPDNILNTDNGERAYAYAAVFGSTYLISPLTVNSFRVSWNEDEKHRIPPQYFESSDLGIKAHSTIRKVMSVDVTSGFTLGGGPGIFLGNLYQIADDVSMTRGLHQLGVGVHLGQSRTRSNSASNAAGNFTFGGAVTGLGLADFLTGKLAAYEEGLANESWNRVNYVGMYAQDTWQVRPRLTINGGVRWSPILPIMDYKRPVPNVLNFDLNRYYQGQRSSVFLNAPPGFIFPGDPGFVQNNNGATAEKPKADLFNPQWLLFAPRLGLAWDVGGDGRTSVRASASQSYEDYAVSYMKGTILNQPPWGFTTRVDLPVGGFDDPWLAVPGGDPFTNFTFSKNMPWVPAAIYMPAVSHIAPTTTQSWTLSVQREVIKDTLLSASYLGTHIIHLQAAEPLNPVAFIAGVGDAGGNCFLNGQATYFKVAPGAPCSTVANGDARRKLALERPQYATEIGPMGQITAGGTQNYHGLLLSAQRRPTRGINVNANYTWSHCVGDFQARLQQAPGADMTYTNPNDRRSDRGACEYDQRHALNLTGVAEMPRFANRTLRWIGSGWRLSGIYKRGSAGAQNAFNRGAGFRTVTLDNDATTSNAPGTTDPCRCRIRGQRPDLVLQNVYLDTSGRPGTQYLNPAAFAVPAVGNLGNLGRNTLKLPTAWQFDMALARVFRFREDQSLEFRAEAYNLTNSFRPGAIDVFLRSSNFGKIRNALEPRILQFALKYAF
jgi:hypothetical protein